MISLNFRRIAALMIFAVLFGGSFAVTLNLIHHHKQANTQAQTVTAQQHELATNERVHTYLAHKNDEVEPNVTLKVMNILDVKNLGPIRYMNDDQLRTYSRDLIDTQNRVLSESGVHIRVKLVDTILDREYEPKDNHGGTVLSDWRNDDSKLRAGKNARKRNNADIVMILDDKVKTECGLAYNANLGFHASDAFAVLTPSCNVDPFNSMTYPHELGHTLGLTHDHGVVDDTFVKADPFKTNYGYTDSKNHIYDIMAYIDKCRTKDDQTCTQIKRYSSPKVMVDIVTTSNGRELSKKTVPLGDDHADAVSFMNDHLSYYAAMNYNAGN